MNKLKEMLTYRRPSRSNTEKEFINKFIRPIKNMKEDSHGNLYLSLGKSDTLFSCHTDTVHRKHGIQGYVDDTVFGVIYKDDGEVLVADNTAGVWIMLNLIENNISGLYVFHKDEEIGGLGSRWIAKHRPNYIMDINKAIAFDRKGQHEVITHQYNGRCCSDTFGNSLAKYIGLNYAISDNGIFTDTANYIDFISECTNISVGYENEHTKNEYLDYNFLVNDLMPSLLEVPWDKLPIERKFGYNNRYIDHYEDEFMSDYYDDLYKEYMYEV